MKKNKEKLKRNDSPNVILDELLERGWKRVDNKYEYSIRAILNMIRSELDRLHWNKNQKEMTSPFDNTSEFFKNDYATIRAYNWDENELPNFDTDQLKVFWYKHSNRGVYALVPPNADINKILVDVLNNTIQSLKETYGER